MPRIVESGLNGNPDLIVTELAAWCMPWLMTTKGAWVGVLLLLGVGLSSAPSEEPREGEVKPADGDLDAMFELGSVAILEGRFVEARGWLEKASTSGHAPSMAALGFLHFNGFVVEKDLKKARALYEASAAKGAHQGLNNLAHLYRYGLAGLDKDLKRAVELLEEAARKGNDFSVNALASLYRGQELGAPDLAKALEWLKFGAERNNPGCLSDLGYAYQHGIEVKQDLARAAELYRKAVAAGSIRALSNLGYLFLMGLGVERDYAEALRLFTKAVELKDPAGMINLAVMKYRGLGCERKVDEAFALLNEAGDLGSQEAIGLLRTWKATEEKAKTPK